MKLRAVYFLDLVPIDAGTRVGSLVNYGREWEENECWSLEMDDGGVLHATKNGRVLHLENYAWSYEEESAAAVASPADGGESVGSTPARPPRRRKSV